ncbi:protein phosphatase regulator [Savitreella phatthalungensis]
MSALELFYAEHGGDDARSASSADAGGTGERVGSAGVGEIGRPSSGSSVNGGGGGGRASKSSSSRRTGLATFSSLRDAEEEDDDDDEKPAEFYTGGEKSGLGVIDPNKARRQQGTGGAGTSAGGSAGPQDLLEQILRKAAA